MLVGILIISLFLNVATGAYAQEALGDLLRDYRMKQDLYRDMVNEFVVAQQQYQTNPSIVNRETYVTQSKELLKRRAIVWSAFFNTLGIQMAGLRDQLTEPYVQLADEVGETQAALTQHRVNIDEQVSLSGLTEEADWLNERSEEYQSLSFEAQAWVKLAEYFRALEAVKLFGEDMQTLVETQIVDEADQSLRLRTVGDELVQLNDLELRVTTLIADEYETGDDEFGEGDYEDVIEGLVPLHQQLEASFVILEEMSRGLVL